MELNRLTVGDFVRYENEIVQIVRIDGLKYRSNGFEVRVFNVGKHEYLTAYSRELESIPLNLQTVNGNFTKDVEVSDGYLINNNYGVLLDEDKCTLDYAGIEMKTVHELQHFLRLIGYYNMADNIVIYH